jgi:hypothetical protein
MNYVFNNKGGGQYALQAEWDSTDTYIKYFKVDIDGSNYDTDIYYVWYTSDGQFDYITGSGGEKYYKHDFFTTPFSYTIFDCNADTNTTSSPAYKDEFTAIVF